MNRTEIIDIIARQEELEAPVVDLVLKSFVSLLLLNLAVGESVTIRGFGRFDPKTRPSASLRHPRTGARIETGVRRTIGFRPSMRAKDQLNPHEEPHDTPRESTRPLGHTPSASMAGVAGSGSPSPMCTAISGGSSTIAAG